MTNNSDGKLTERLRGLAEFAEAAEGNHSRSVHPETVAKGFRQAADTIEALVEALKLARMAGRDFDVRLSPNELEQIDAALSLTSSEGGE